METFYVTKVSHHYFLPFMEEEEIKESAKQNGPDSKSKIQNSKSPLPLPRITNKRCMDSKKLRQLSRWHWKRIIQYFFQGIIILAPITITVWAVISLFSFIDSLVPGLIHRVAPGLLKTDATGQPANIPGLGFILVVLIVFLVGYVSSFFVVGRLVDIFDKILERTPGIKFIYSSVKDFFEAFAGDKKKFNRPVLVSLDNNDVWQVAFITQDDGHQFELPAHVAVYVPFSYSIAGKVYWVPAERIKPLPHVNAGDAMKFAISGGVTHVEEGH